MTFWEPTDTGMVHGPPLASLDPGNPADYPQGTLSYWAANPNTGLPDLRMRVPDQNFERMARMTPYLREQQAKNQQRLVNWLRGQGQDLEALRSQRTLSNLLGTSAPHPGITFGDAIEESVAGGFSPNLPGMAPVNPANFGPYNTPKTYAGLQNYRTSAWDRPSPVVEDIRMLSNTLSREDPRDFLVYQSGNRYGGGVANLGTTLPQNAAGAGALPISPNRPFDWANTATNVTSQGMQAGPLARGLARFLPGSGYGAGLAESGTLTGFGGTAALPAAGVAAGILGPKLINEYAPGPQGAKDILGNALAGAGWGSAGFVLGPEVGIPTTIAGGAIGLGKGVLESIFG